MKERKELLYELWIQRGKLVERRSLHDALRNEKVIFQSSKTKTKKQKKKR